MEEGNDAVGASRVCSLAVQCAGRANFALQQNDVPIIREIAITNEGPAKLEDIIIAVTIGGDFGKRWESRVAKLDIGETRKFQKIDLQLDSTRLANQLERERVELKIEATASIGLVGSWEAPLEILAFNEWPGTSLLPEILAAFVSPNHPLIENLLGEVRDAIGLATGNTALSGYQSGSRERSLAIFKAIYDAMQKSQIGYVNPPASYEREGQKIRTPDQVLGGSKLGTCLDLTVIAAAAIEQTGLHPLLLLVEGHAFVGVWLHDEQFSEPAVDDATRILNRVRLREIAVFETTALCDGRTVAFADAMRLGLERLQQTSEFRVGIDVKAARRAGIRPLPPRIKSGGGFDVLPVVTVTPPQSSAQILPSSQPERRRVRPTKEKKLPADLSPEAVKRLDHWKRKLLDLSLRNPLLNFKVTAKVVPLLVPDVVALEDRLAHGHTFQIAPRSGTLDPNGPRDLDLERERTGRDIPTEMLIEEMNRGLLRADLNTDFDRRLVELFRAARMAIEETGTNTLFLAIGSLYWYESTTSQERRIAPLMLVPVRLERSQPGHFRIQILDEDVRVNVTLIEKLEHDFGLEASPLGQPVDDEKTGFDVRECLSGFTRLIKDMPRWEIKETAHLGQFSFSKFLLWADLEERIDQVSCNPVVRYLLERPDRPLDSHDFPDTDNLDSLIGTNNAVSPMDSDSSQQAAIEAAILGKTFVLQGPPGTGKSQTITNLIARAAFEGKRVLFVAEKMAALTVVQRRLAQSGLAPFILELHSAKSGKKDVLTQLGRALETGRMTPGGGWESETRRLFEIREKLNSHVKALHAKRFSGESVFEVTGRLAPLLTAPRCKLRISEPAAMTSGRLATLRRAVAEAINSAESVGDIATHPLRGIRAVSWRLDLSDQASAAISNTVEAASKLQEAISEWFDVLKLSRETVATLNANEIGYLAQMAKLILERCCPSRSIVSEPGWDVLNCDILDLAKTGRQRDALRTELLAKYSKDYLSADHEGLAASIKRASASSFIFRWFRQRRAMKAIRAMMVGDGARSESTLLADLDHAIDLQKQQKQLCQSNTATARAIGILLRSGEADWNAIEKTATWAGEFRKLLTNYPQNSVLKADDIRRAFVDAIDPDLSQLADGGPVRIKTEAFIAATTFLREAIERLRGVLDASLTAIIGKDSQSLFQTLSDTLSKWESAFPRLAEWASWQRVFRREDIPELRDLLDDLDTRRLQAKQASDVFEASYARIWLSAIMPVDPALQHFSCDNQSHLINEFRKSDEYILKLSREIVATKLSAQIPQSHSSNIANSEIGILRRQLALQRNHKPVRRLIKEMPTLLPRLKPVWLMSPLSVAQYLDPSIPPFDLVIFDEASQIPVWDAVGTLARGAQVVVVGDSKQLPPTNFFQRQDDGLEAPDEADVEELESILDECVAASLPELKLKWHYRSRHESLIAFSNHHYYDNELLTFPSADSTTSELGVSMKFLSYGRYDRGGSRTNRAEADAIVAEIFRRLMLGEQRTMGVVTFSSAQQILIEDLIDERLRKNPELQIHFAASQTEPVFVKNLENVQGDERDVIFFSICYGPDDAGKLSLGFGPLNRDGGERRLNVAITRARQQVIVFTSIKADQIDLSRSRAKGLAHLRTFLDYAERGPTVLREEVTDGVQADWESPFEMAVYKAIRDKGWTVDTQIGCSGYRIDLAIRDPARAGRYLLGIECDGATYHSAKTARDRDRLREQVLKNLGWRLHRVWSTDWLQNPHRCIERIEAALAAAKIAQPSPLITTDTAPPVGLAAAGISDAALISGLTESATVASVESIFHPQESIKHDFSNVSVKHIPPGARPYICHRFSGGGRSQDLFYASRSERRLVDDLNSLVITEGPIHVDRARLIIARAWGMQRVTNRVEERITSVVRRASIVRRGDFFVSPNSDYAAVDYFRIVMNDYEEALPFEHVPPGEIAACISSVLKEQFGLPIADLEREVIRIFGYQRSSSTARNRVREVLDNMISAGRCSRDGDMVRI